MVLSISSGLWRTDGRTTQLLSENTGNTNWVSDGSNIYFGGTDEVAGYGLFVSDGTTLGTRFYGRLIDGYSAYYHLQLYEFSGKIYVNGQGPTGSEFYRILED